MNPMDQGNADEYMDAYLMGYGKQDMSYPELCSEFISALTKSIRSVALYRLSHPMVTDLLRKDAVLLNMILTAKNEGAVTISHVNDSWYFNNAEIRSMSQDAQTLYTIFKAHNIQGLTFIKGVRSFEVGVLCEFAGSTLKNQPEEYFKDFLIQRGVTNIKPEIRRYVMDSGSSAQGPGGRTATSTVAPASRPSGFSAKPESASPPESAPRVSPRPELVSVWEEMETPAASARVAKAAAPPPAPEAPKPQPAAKPAGEAAVTPPPKLEVHTGPAPDMEHMFAVKPAPEIPPASSVPHGPVHPKNTLHKEGDIVSVNFGALLTKLIDSVVKDPKERVHAYEEALKRIQDTMEQQVARSTDTLVKEKEQILNTRARTERVLANVAAGKVIVDKDGKILMMNPAAEEIAGKKFADVVGCHITEHVRPGEHFIALSKDMDLSSGKQLTGEVHVSGDEHVQSAIRRSMALLEDDEGRVVGAYTTLPDITKFKEIQRMQEEFLSRVTHDLQTPLSSINSALEMLTETASNKLDTDENNFLAISIRNSQRLVHMIREILDFSKLQSGRMSVHPEPASIAAMLKEAGEGLMPWAKTKGIALTVRPPEPDLYVMADHQRIVQVLTNLISNAIKATPKGGSVIAAASPGPNHDKSVIIGVRDTGHGIPKEDLKRVFEKFVQLGGSEPQEGVGLGLAIVREFVALHGGRIWVNSEAGKGATFYFTLPVAEKRSPVLG